jgi:FixJ family two-component response regulator
MPVAEHRRGMTAVGTTSTQRFVAIVDDDESLRRSLPELLGALAVATRTFESAQAFLRSGLIETTQCLILDVGMPEMSGPELQQELVRLGHAVPIIFISGRTDDALRKTLIARGAIDCLVKPFSSQRLRAALEQAIGDL